MWCPGENLLVASLQEEKVPGTPRAEDIQLSFDEHMGCVCVCVDCFIREGFV